MRILIIPYTHTLSHLSRPLAVASELRKLGHTIFFAGESLNTALITKEGFDVIPCYEPDPTELYGNIRSGKLKFATEETVVKMVEADLSVIQKTEPDLVLTDGRFSAMISTHVARVRHAAIVNVSSTEFRALPYIPFFDWLPVSRQNPLWKTLDRINLKLEMLLFDSVMNVFEKTGRAFGTTNRVTATNCLTGNDITLLADIPEYFPTRNLPASYHYVGPLTWKAKLPPPPWWEPQLFSRPVVYFTLGSTGTRDLFNALNRMLHEFTGTAIVTTGNQECDMPEGLANVFVEPLLDGDLIMEYADVVICHGGNGTIYQALSNGKPVIGIPTIPDQRFNMRRVEALGVGMLIELEKVKKDPHILMTAVDKLLHDTSYPANAAKMRAILQNYESAKLCASILTGCSRNQ